MNSNIRKVIEELEMGILPVELTFNQEMIMNEELIAKIQYNSFYKTFDYWADKFPSGFLNLPGADKIINHIKDNAITPLKELNKRSNNNISINNIEDEPEFTHSNECPTENERY